MKKQKSKFLVPQHLRNLVPFKKAFTLAEGATHVGVFDNCRRCAFTLAEVLITLGIIGIVAAMTIPTLIQDYNTRVWNTSATVFNRKLEEALKTMNTQQTLAGHTTTESFVEELSKHFKTNKICQNDELLDCFSETVYWGGGEATPEEVDMKEIKKAKNFGQDDWDTNIVGVLFANGVSALIAYNPTTGENSCTQDPYSNQITGGDCLAILYDTSANKNPNTSGKDLRANGNVKKLGSGCAFKIGNTCYGMPFLPEAHIWNACTAEGTSTDPDDNAFMQKYNIDHCANPRNGSNDYWAGAVKECGGKDKLPTKEQYEAFAEYIYGMTVSSSAFTNRCPEDSNGNKTYCRNDNNVISLGFTLPSNYSLYVWTGEEAAYTSPAHVGSYCWMLNRYETAASHLCFRYHNTDIWGVCLEN